MKRRTQVAVNLILIAAIFLLPGLSVTAANITAETGLLTRVDGHHVLTLGWANGMGLGFFNLITIGGLFLVVNSLIWGLNRVRSTPG